MKFVICLCLFILLLLAVPVGAIEVPTGHPEIRLFFNQPPGDGGIEDAAVELIDSAKKHIFIACFEIGRDRIVAALRRAAERLGPDNVRIVSERRYVTGAKLQSYYRALTEAGISVEYDGKRRNPGQGLMHNKFIVVDDRIVWTGSLNFTKNNLLEDDNNVLILESPELAAAYRAEFAEMYDDGQFGGRKLDNTAKHFLVGGVPVELRFSPSDNVNERIVECINQAEKSIHFCIFTFTDESITRALIAARGRGVAIDGCFDDRSAGSRHSAWPALKERNFSVRKDDHHSILHHKFMVIDGETERALVITGSHNWTRGADRKNDENTLLIKDKAIAQAYLAEHRRIASADSAPTKSRDEAKKTDGKPAELPTVPAQTREIRLQPDPASADRSAKAGGSGSKPATKVAARPRAVPRSSGSKQAGDRPFPREKLRDALRDGDRRMEEELAAYLEARRRYDQCGWLEFAARDSAWRDMNRRYAEYNALRLYRNRLAELLQTPPEDLSQLLNRLASERKEAELRRRRMENSGEEDEARLAALRQRELELILPLLESLR